MAQPSQLPVHESLPRFMLAWLPVIALPVAVLVTSLLVPTIEISSDEDKYAVVFIGLMKFGLFGCAIAASQWWALRRRVPHAGRWGIMTLAGSLGATFAYGFVRGFSLSKDGVPIFGDVSGVIAGTHCDNCH